VPVVRPAPIVPVPVVLSREFWMIRPPVPLLQVRMAPLAEHLIPDQSGSVLVLVQMRASGVQAAVTWDCPAQAHWPLPPQF
jgi:hypothetical protein